MSYFMLYFLFRGLFSAIFSHPSAILWTCAYLFSITMLLDRFETDAMILICQPHRDSSIALTTSSLLDRHHSDSNLN